MFSIKHLQYREYGPVDLQLQATQSIGISGESGSGKSLLLRALADLDAHEGEVCLDDIKQQDICAHLWRKKIALLSAETFWWFDTVGEHFTELSNKQCQELGFTQNIAGWQVSRLSSGEKQRLGLLRLLENQPEVLLLDEPTANLDKSNTVIFEKFVQQYLQSRPACAIWVSHDIEQLQRVAERCFEMKDGGLLNKS